jgi:hypothetical protein
MFGAATAAFVVSLFVSVSFGEAGPEVALLGDEACADTTGSCQEDCDLQQEACVKAVKKVTEVSKCFECCKNTEDEGRVGMDTTPTRDELHQHMLDKCVFPMSAVARHPEWVRGFPRDLHAAEAFDPNAGPIGEALKKRFGARETSEANTGRGPKSADESACIKGCAYRTRLGMDVCHSMHHTCRSKCGKATGAAARCGKR